MAMADNTLISSEHISPPASEDTNYKNGLEDWPALSRQRDSNAPLYSAEFSKARFLYAAVSLERDAVLQSDAEGSGSDYKLAVWRPNSKGVRIRGKPGSAADDHVHLNQYLGQTASQGIFANPAPKVRAVLFRKEDDVLPVGCGHEWWWELWSDGGLAETESITVWQIRGNLVPSSHSCLSPIFFKKTRKSDPVREPPRADEVAGMVLVRWDLVDFVRGEDLKFVWSERGMKLVDNPTGCTIWTTPDGVGTYAFAMPYKVYVGNYPILDWSVGEEVPLHRIVVPPPPPADPSLPMASFRAFLGKTRLLRYQKRRRARWIQSRRNRARWIWLRSQARRRVHTQFKRTKTIRKANIKRLRMGCCPERPKIGVGIGLLTELGTSTS